MIAHVSIFPEHFLRRCVPLAVLLAAFGSFAWSAAEDPAWGRFITSAAIACNPSTHKIYAVNEGTSSITVIDASTGAAHTVKVGMQPIAIGINSTTNRTYVVNGGSASVSVIDGTNDTVVATVTSALHPYTIAVDETSNKIYVTHTYSGTLSAIDGASNAVRELKVGDADGIALDPRTGTVFLSTYEDPSVRFVSEATGALTKPRVGPHIWGMAFDRLSDTLFLAHMANAEVVALNEKTHVVRTLPVGKIPCALSINPVTRRLYVVNYGDETISVLDLQTMATVATLPVGPRPQGVAVDSKSDRVFVANLQGNSVTVIDGATNAVVDIRKAGAHPYALAVDQSSGHAYAANYGAPWVTQIQGVPPVHPPSRVK